MTVMKLQRPTDDPTQPWVINDETREHVGVIPAVEIDHRVRDLMGADGTGYFNVEVLPGDVYQIGVRVSGQDW